MFFDRASRWKRRTKPKKIRFTLDLLTGVVAGMM